MSKRRTLESLGNLPYTTIDGGRWLKKALDPADIDVDVAGLPDINTNPRTVLNYQYQGDIPLPSPTTYNANIVQSYDVNFYVYQNPIVFGTSVSYPSGSKPLGGGTPIIFKADGTAVLPDAISPVNGQIFMNSQIEGDTLTEKCASMTRYCQKYRMIYGGVQCIPACSALFDSGTIEATQQIFTPKIGSISNEIIISSGTSTNKLYRCQTFHDNDFPDSGDGIQNPTTLYCRYKEGLYMPYKLRNPLVYDYSNSEEYCVSDSPYYVTAEAALHWNETINDVATNHQTVLNFNPDTRSFEPANPVTGTVTWMRWDFKCVSKTGLFFKLSFIWSNPNPSTPLTWELDYNLPILDSNVGSLDNDNFKVYITGADPSVNANPSTAVGTELVPYINETNIGVVCFRSIGLQATIRVIFRMGVEMMITAGGVYSPFKHKAPKYDQRALSTYARTVHLMRDAFLGNAATPEGHAEFGANLASLIVLDEATAGANMGTSWYGRVSV